MDAVEAGMRMIVDMLRGIAIVVVLWRIDEVGAKQQLWRCAGISPSAKAEPTL